MSLCPLLLDLEGVVLLVPDTYHTKHSGMFLMEVV